MKYILLNKDKRTIVDDEDFDRLNQNKWHYAGPTYAVRTIHKGYSKDGKRITGVIWMHREIMNTPEGLFTDHINGDTLDNRKGNLRIVTSKQNKWNSMLPSHNTSGYKGVSEIKRNLSKKWEAYITVDDKKCHIGYFSSKEDAARAYNKVAKEIFGEYARLNNLILFKYEYCPDIESVHQQIKNCEGRCSQQTAFSTYHDALTQICYGCRTIRTTIKVMEK